MDQVKIGRFIAERRKKVNLTQAQLSEKLNITDKAISKWERGKAMPDVSIMLELCGILEISVNELLSGEEISMENNNEKNEQLLLDMCGCFGVDEDDVIMLLDYGYSADEIEAMLMDYDMISETVNAVKNMEEPYTICG